VTHKPSQAVTCRCAACGSKFKANRVDARYCSGACRTRAHRARAQLDALDREIEAARLRYWTLIAEKARAVGGSAAIASEVQSVELDGTVRINGRAVGRREPHRPGWAA
jgi:hypothetical protein